MGDPAVPLRQDGQTQRELSRVAIEPPTAARAARVLSADELETLKTLLRRVIDGLTREEAEEAGSS